MNSRTTLGQLGLFAAVILALGAGCDQSSKPTVLAANPRANAAPVTFKPQEMADALHAVIAADRETYVREVIEKHKDGANPLPAHMMKLASAQIQQKGAEFHYVLRSLWPINPKNAPETPVEKNGLETVLKDSEKPYYAEESLGGRRYFTAVYPDKAVVSSCAECHNNTAACPKKDFKPGDVMGALVVRVPLEF